MSRRSDFHEIPVYDADWETAKRLVDEAPNTFGPDDPKLRPGHSSRGKKEAREVAKIALERWATEHGVTLDGRCKARAYDYGNTPLVPVDDVQHGPDVRHCHLERAAKRVGHTTTWIFTGWRPARDAPQLTKLRKDLHAYPVPVSKLHTPAELVADLRRSA